MMEYSPWKDFVDHFINSVNKVVPFHSFFSYEIGDLNHSHYAKNLTKQSIEHYIHKMFEFDPVFLNKKAKKFTEISLLHQYAIPDEYDHFLKINNVSDNIELLFQINNADPIGISLIRHANEGVFSQQEINIIESCYSLAKYNQVKNNQTKNITSQQNINLSDEIMHKLTPTELQVLSLVLEGKKNQDIANNLFVSLATIKTHIHHIFQKTLVNSKQALILKILSA